ncbi:O-methyltransferase [Hyphodiscus hymeniophilus]|uniref:O-methyltransferase n=1 Tax=Hyphodiscus hymeniophilus TaxID=353542 RepID=A0A9P6SQE5_9HELO|nr:O-methyltransferase [Hyphodiscus hymeniophilus]
MCKTSPIEAYADEICSAAKIIAGYCALEKIPQPSFEPHAPSVTLPPSAPTHVLEARQRLIGAAAKIQQLATEPSEFLPGLAVQYQLTASIRWLAHFSVLPCVPLQGSVPYSDIASMCNVPVRTLRSVVRLAMTANFLCEPVVGEVAHTSISSQFVTKPAYPGWMKFMTEFYMPVSCKFVEATEKWGTSVRKDQTAVNLAMGTELSSFDYITGNRDLSRKFAAYMKGVQASEGTNIRYILTSFDWRWHSGPVIHMAGSPGTVAIALAEAFPHLKLLVQDFPDTIKHSHGLLAVQSQEIRSRITTAEHNIFEPQPHVPGAVYILRMLLHNWCDAEATKILASLLPAMKSNPSARILIIDTLLPEPGTVDSVSEAMMRYRDMTMMQVFNTKERDLDEFKALFEQASDHEARLVLKSIRHHPGSTLSVLEVGCEMESESLAEG